MQCFNDSMCNKIRKADKMRKLLVLENIRLQTFTIVYKYLNTD